MNIALFSYWPKRANLTSSVRRAKYNKFNGNGDVKIIIIIIMYVSMYAGWPDAEYAYVACLRLLRLLHKIGDSKKYPTGLILKYIPAMLCRLLSIEQVEIKYII